MRNYKMILAYDGSRYKGWQRLGRGELTIQAVLENVVSEVIGYEVDIHGSGRTDAGVHAKGQVAHMKVPFALKENVREACNQVLPEDIRILQITPVKSGFHSRYSAVAKWYQYYVDTAEKPDVFRRKYSCHYPEHLNVAAMKEASRLLIGTHDFSSFTDDKMLEKEKVRTIYEIKICEQNGQIRFSYHGDGFLQHMVRILTGTLLEVGSGKKQPSEILTILKERNRSCAGFMAPAKGLFLEKVEYKEEEA